MKLIFTLFLPLGLISPTFAFSQNLPSTPTKEFNGNRLQLPKKLPTRYLLLAAEKAGEALPKMNATNATSWSKSFPEETEQSFMEHTLAAAAVPYSPADTIYILPLSEFSAEKKATLQKTAELLSLFYGAKVKTLDPLSTAGLHKNANGQINADEITDNFLLSRVSQSVASSALSIVAVTDTDLYYEYGDEKLNFVFGASSGNYPIQTWSFNRFGNANGTPEEKAKVVERALKISVHESGHQFGLPHTKTHRCILNGYNNLDDLDSSPLELCPGDSSKIWYDRKLDPVTRYEALIEFAKKNSILPKEVKIWESALAKIKTLDQKNLKKAPATAAPAASAGAS